MAFALFRWPQKFCLEVVYIKKTSLINQSLKSWIHGFKSRAAGDVHFGTEIYFITYWRKCKSVMLLSMQNTLKNVCVFLWNWIKRTSISHICNESKLHFVIMEMVRSICPWTAANILTILMHVWRSQQTLSIICIEKTHCSSIWRLSAFFIVESIVKTFCLIHTTQIHIFWQYHVRMILILIEKLKCNRPPR